jgi:hypothetical protein
VVCFAERPSARGTTAGAIAALGTRSQPRKRLQ